MSERILGGSRACFGIAIEVTSLVVGVWAYVLLWIAGEPPGTEEDAFTLYSLLGSMGGPLKIALDEATTAEMSRSPSGAAWSRFEAPRGRAQRAHVLFFDRYEVRCVSDHRAR